LVIFCILYVLFPSITNAQDGYILSDATRFLMYSYSAYCDPPNLTSWDCYWCDYVNGVEPISVQYIFQNASYNTLGYAGVTSDSIIFSFRGTEASSLKNWITDLTSEILVSYPYIPNAFVGEGFLYAYEGIQSQVITAAQQLGAQYPAFPFIVVGHSLGAALSLLCLADLSYQLNIPASSLFAWNYGDPRVGDSVFSNAMAQALTYSWRTVNQDDIVPHLPPQVLGFEHTWTEVWFPNSTSYYEICTNGPEDPNCSDSVYIDDYSINDHLTYLGFDQRWGHAYNCH